MEMATYGRLIDGLRDVPSLRQISFWGFGEPLLHPGLVEMVSLAKALGVRTELITQCPPAGTRKRLRGWSRHSAGQPGHWSMDVRNNWSADVRPGAALRRVRENVGRLLAIADASGRSNPEIGLAFVAMRRNIALAGCGGWPTRSRRPPSR